MMKRGICLLLCLLLCGCGTQPAQTTEPTPTLSFADSLAVTERYVEPEDPDARLAWRRDLVEQRMRHMMTLLWTTEQDIVYDFGDGPLTLYKGRIYEGMPYSHGSAADLSFLRFATGQDERGIYTISGLNGAAMTNNPGVPYISNNCADALFWAWGAVACDLTFLSTNQMTSYNGCISVGDYVCNRTRYDGATTVVAQENGLQTMMNCYAQMQKGDGMVYYTDEKHGHAVMVASVVVAYDQNGAVDPQNSYVLILDQNGIGLAEERTRFDEALGQEVYTLCGVDRKLSFQRLFDGGYLPVTCRELIDPAPLEEEWVTDSQSEHSLKTIISGTLKSNYRISHVQMTIYDAKGQQVQSAVGFGTEKFMYSYMMINLRNELTTGAIDPDKLSSGTYRCVLTCTVSTGRTLTVRDFTFTK